MNALHARLAARLFAAALLAAALPAQPVQAQGAAGPQQPSRHVLINEVRLPAEQLRAFEVAYRVRVADGRYWYDRQSGAWGVEGYPTAGLILPGLPLGGALREDASNGSTYVWVNGRRLPPADLFALQRLTGTIRPGRYWLDGNGYAGYEGGPPLVNLHHLASRAGGGRGGAWSRYSRATDAGVGGNGDFFYYIDRTTSATGGN